MSLQGLHDFFRLEVPYEDLIILPAGHDPFTASHREAGKYTVLFVLMSGVCLQTFPRVIVPQAKGVIQCASKNVLAIRRKFDEGDRRIVIINQGL